MTVKTPTKEILVAAQSAARNPHRLAAMIGIPVSKWVGRCHEVSLALLKTGEFGKGRVARGMANGVVSQHSWIVLDEDVYSERAVIVDATNPVFHDLYDMGRRDAASTGTGTPILVTATATGKSHTPHGMGDIWKAGRPDYPTGEIVQLTPTFELSADAKLFLSDDTLGPLDRRGWAQLANGPMQGWPASEIIAAMDDTDRLRALVPIDILGMLTLRNPQGLYLADGREEDV
jgi:hypothetical protein